MTVPNYPICTKGIYLCRLYDLLLLTFGTSLSKMERPYFLDLKIKNQYR